VVVLVDIREKGSIVPKHLIKLGTPIEYKQLPVGDYIVHNLCIERKDVRDYVGSLVSNHLNDQLYNMSYNYPVSILIVEGFVDEILVFRKLKRQQYISSLAGSILKRAPEGEGGIINLICLSTPFDTALFIHYLHKKIEEGDLFRLPKIVGRKRKVSQSERQVLVISSLPGIGSKRAKILLSHFGSIANLVNADLNEIKSVQGIGGKTAEEIYNVLHGEFKPEEVKYE